MPLLGGLLTSLFSGLAVWFGQWFTRKVAIGMTAVTVMSAFTAGLYLLMRSTLVELAAGMVGAPRIFMDGLQMVIPPVAPACISTYVSIWTACTVYTWQRDLLHLFAKST